MPINYFTGVSFFEQKYFSASDRCVNPVVKIPHVAMRGAWGVLAICLLLVGMSMPSRAEETGNAAEAVWLGFPLHVWDAKTTPLNHHEDKPFGSAFLKQLRRQAILVAAREELGMATRDEFLGETAPEGCVKIDDADRFLVDHLNRNLFGQNIDYPKFLEELERLSRNELVAALEKSGCRRAVAPKTPGESNGEVPEKIVSLLQDLSLVSQFEAIRQLHRLIREEGESPARLAALVRGYSQLQLLTGLGVRDTHRVFQARAILYAQRAVAKYGDTAEMRGLRGMAWSLNNFHRLAREEFAAPAFAPVLQKEESDILLHLAVCYADYDIDGMATLIAALDGNPEQPMAKLLQFWLLFYTDNIKTLVYPYGSSIIADLPNCGVLYQALLASEAPALFDTPFLAPTGETHHDYFAALVPSQIAKMNGIPDNVVQAATIAAETVRLNRGAMPPTASYRDLGKLYRLLKGATLSSDRAEPSLQALATLMQDDFFYTVLLATYDAGRHGQPADSLIQAAVALLETHPFMLHLGVACSHQDDREAYKKKLDAYEVPYELFSQNVFSTGIRNRNLWDSGRLFAPYIFADRYADRENVRDLFFFQKELRWHSRPDMPLYTIAHLEAICPNNPFTVAERVARNWAYDDAEADALLAKYAAYPNFREAITARIMQSGRSEKAIDLMQRDLEANPTDERVIEIAMLLINAGHPDKAIEVLEHYIETPGDGQIDRGEMMQKIGMIAFAIGRYQEAEQYFTAAADRYSTLARLQLSGFLEAIGKTNEAGKLFQNTLPGGRMEATTYWGFCFRSNNPDLNKATENLFTATLERSESLWELFYIAYCMDRPMQGLFGNDPGMNRFYRDNNPVAGYFSFFEAMEKGDKLKATTILHLIRELGPAIDKEALAHTLAAANIPVDEQQPKLDKPTYKLLAAMFERDLRREKPGALDERDVEQLLRIGYGGPLERQQVLWLLYLLGRYYGICGEQEKSLECYRRLFAVRFVNFDFPGSLAVKEMRKAGLPEGRYLEWLKTDPKLLPRQLDPQEIASFTRRIVDAAEATADNDAADGAKLCRSTLPATAVLTTDWEWNAPQAKTLRTLAGRQNGTYYADWSADGKIIATTGVDHFALAWNVSTGELLAEMKRPINGRGASIAFTPDGSAVYYGTTADMFGRWDIRELLSQEQKPLWESSAAPWTGCVAPSSDGRLVCTAAESGGAAIWEADTGKCVHSLSEQRGAAYCATFFAGDSRLAVSAADKAVVVYDTTDWRPLLRLEGAREAVRAVAVSPDGRILASGSCDDFVMLWDAESGEPLRTLGPFGHDITALAFSPDGTKLAVARNGDGMTFILDTQSWKPVARIEGRGPWNCRMAWSPDGKQIVTCGDQAVISELQETGMLVRKADDVPDDVKTIPLKKAALKRFSIFRSPMLRSEPFSSVRGTFPESLWAHAPAIHVFAIEKKWKKLKTSYGLRSDADLTKANCIFIVRGDGRELFRSEAIRDHLDRPLELDVSGVDELELIVDPLGSDSSDYSVWFTPELLR